MKLHISITNIMILVGVIIFSAYLYFVGFWQVVEIIKGLDIKIALFAIAIDLICISLFALSWKVLLKSPGIKLKDSFIIVLVSIFGDMMIPTASVSGEVMRISLTTKKTKLNLSEVAASVLMHRLALGITFGIVLGVSITMLLVTQTLNLAALSIFIFIGVVVIILGGMGILATVNICKFKKIAEVCLTKMAGIIHHFRPSFRLENALLRMERGLEEIQRTVNGISRGRILLSTMLLIARWFIMASIPYLMFVSLGYRTSYWIVLTVSIFVSMVQMIPVGIPGMVGVMEVSMTTFFIGFGIPTDIAASSTILTRLVMFWFELLISASAASFQGLSDLLAKARNTNGIMEHTKADMPIHATR